MTLDLFARAIAQNTRARLASRENGQGAAMIGVSTGSNLQENIEGFASRNAIRELKAHDGARAYLREDRRSGTFVYRQGNFSTAAAADPAEGLHIVAQGSAASSGCWVRQVDGQFNVKWWGASGNGATDDTTAIQAAIDAVGALGGGTVGFPAGTYRHTGITLRSKVALVGLGAGYRGEGGAILHCTVDGGAAITVPVGATATAVSNFYIRGTTSNSSAISRGIVCYAPNARFNNLTIRFFNDEGIWLSTGAISCSVVDCAGINLGLNRAPTDFKGGLRIGGTDNYIDRCQFGMSQNYTDANTTGPGWQQLTSESMFNAAIMVEGADNWITNSSGENADIGLYLTAAATRNKILNFRGDQAWGHSAWIKGSNNLITNYEFNTISQHGDGLYSAIKVEGAANVITGVIGAAFARFPTSAPVACRPSYVVEDKVAASQIENRTQLSAISGPHAAALIKSEDYLGSPHQPPAIIDRTSSTTPDASRTSFFVATHSSATTITDILNGNSGKIVSILAITANTTIAHNARIALSGWANKKLNLGQLVSFQYYNGKWYELAPQNLPKQAAIAPITVTAAKGVLPVANGSVTISDAAAPTNSELLEYCREQDAKIDALRAALTALGLTA